MKRILTLIICLSSSIIFSQNLKEKNIVIRGQLQDQEYNTPISFATLIIEKEEIYRVADENGFYELPINEDIMKNANVEISSMGYETKIIPLSKLTDITFLSPKFEELIEVTITALASPEQVLKKAISSKKLNYPVKPFNFYRYGKVLINKNDTDELDLEIITKDYDYGYTSPYVITQRVEQIKWNTNNQGLYNHAGQFFSYRQNAIRYGSILDKKKYKNFNLSFVKSKDADDESFHIISFQTNKNNWRFTNKGYPTKYSGIIFIDKKSFAIVKVLENWETTLDEDNIKKHLHDVKPSRRYQGFEYSDDLIKLTIKEENICYYSDIENNGKYYATNYYNSAYVESAKRDGTSENNIYIRDSDLFDFQLKNTEEIEYYELTDNNENLLDRVSYDENFWNAFYTRQIGKKLK